MKRNLRMQEYIPININTTLFILNKNIHVHYICVQILLAKSIESLFLTLIK